MTTHSYEALELCAHIFGIDPDAEDLDDKVEVALDERWGIDLDTFAAIAGELLVLTPTLQSPLSGKMSHVLGKQDGNAFIALMRCDA